MEDTRRQLAGLSSMTLRGLIEKANERGIAKDDIVTVVRESESYILLYYKEIVEG